LGVNRPFAQFLVTGFPRHAVTLGRFANGDSDLDGDLAGLG
jgi:hypothetical protein